MIPFHFVYDMKTHASTLAIPGMPAVQVLLVFSKIACEYRILVNIMLGCEEQRKLLLLVYIHIKLFFYVQNINMVS